MERLALECRDEGARAKARLEARRHKRDLAEVALQLGLRKRLADAGKAELAARPMAMWELAGEALGSVVALLRRVDGVVRDGVVARVVRDALRPSEADRAVLADYASAAPLASIGMALRGQLAGLDKRAADSRPPAAPPPRQRAARRGGGRAPRGLVQFPRLQGVATRGHPPGGRAAAHRLRAARRLWRGDRRRSGCWLWRGRRARAHRQERAAPSSRRASC